MSIPRIASTFALMGMLSYSCFLGIRDSDKSTFENRVREGFKFMEYNVPEYNTWALKVLDQNAKGIDGSRGVPPSRLREMAPVVVMV